MNGTLMPRDEVEVREGFRDRIDADLFENKRLFVKSVHPSEHVKEPWVVVENEDGVELIKRLYKRDPKSGANVAADPASMFPEHYFAKKEVVESGP